MKPNYTEDEIREIAENLDDCDFGLLVDTWMEKMKYRGCDIKTTDSNGGNVRKFEVREVEWFEDEKEDEGNPPPHLDKDGCVYWDSVIKGGN